MLIVWRLEDRSRETWKSLYFNKKILFARPLGGGGLGPLGPLVYISDTQYTWWYLSTGLRPVFIVCTALFLPKLLFIVCCTAFSIHICLLTRGAILLEIESAPLSEDEDEDRWQCSTLFDALHQLSGTHCQKLFSIVTLLQFFTLGYKTFLFSQAFSSSSAQKHAANVIFVRRKSRNIFGETRSFYLERFHQRCGVLKNVQLFGRPRCIYKCAFRRCYRAGGYARK